MIYYEKLISILSKGSSFNVLSTIAVIYNLVAHAGFGYQTFVHDIHHVQKSFLFFYTRRNI